MMTGSRFPLIRGGMALGAVLTPLLLFASLPLAALDYSYAAYAVIAAAGVYILLPPVRLIAGGDDSRESKPAGRRFPLDWAMAFFILWSTLAPEGLAFLQRILEEVNVWKWPLTGLAAFLTGRWIHGSLRMIRAVSDEAIYAYYTRRTVA